MIPQPVRQVVNAGFVPRPGFLEFLPYAKFSLGILLKTDVQTPMLDHAAFTRPVGVFVLVALIDHIHVDPTEVARQLLRTRLVIERL